MRVSIILANIALLTTASSFDTCSCRTHPVTTSVTEFRYRDGLFIGPTGHGAQINHKSPHCKLQEPELTDAPTSPTSVIEDPIPASEVSTPSGSASPEYAPPSPPAKNDEVSVVLDSHNIHRYNHSALPLYWDDTLARNAVILARQCNFDHNM